LRRLIDFQKTKTLWIYPSALDSFTYNAAFLNALRQFAEFEQVTVITIRPKDVSHIKIPQVRMIFVPLRFVPVISRIMFSIIQLFVLPFFVVISKPDYVILGPDISTVSSLPALLISKFTKSKFVLDIRSAPVDLVGFQDFLSRFTFSLSILIARKAFDGMTIITSLMKDEICNNYKIDPDKVGVWTSGVSESLFNPENFSSVGVELRRKLGLTGKFIVFYHGVFTATRGLQETTASIKILQPTYPSIVFFLLGSGPIVTMQEELIQKEGLRENVIIHNPVDQSEVPKFISMCDVCIVPLPNHPYWRAQSPLKLLEYLAMEKVVILTDIPAHRAVIGDAKCGLYIWSIKPAEIAKAIEYAYVNKKNLEKWGKTGRKIIKEQFTWKKAAMDLESYLLSIDNVSTFDNLAAH